MNECVMGLDQQEVDESVTLIVKTNFPFVFNRRDATL